MRKGTVSGRRVFSWARDLGVFREAEKGSLPRCSGSTQLGKQDAGRTPVPTAFQGGVLAEGSASVHLRPAVLLAAPSTSKRHKGARPGHFLQKPTSEAAASSVSFPLCLHDRASGNSVPKACALLGSITEEASPYLLRDDPLSQVVPSPSFQG